jgi:hypothetical protein
MTIIRRSPLFAGLLIAPLAVAQLAPPPPGPDTVQQQPADAQAQEPAVVFRQVERPRPARPDVGELPPFDSLVVRDDDGEIVRIKDQLDILALRRNSLVDEATRERIQPVLREWLADLDQLVIDNLDFLERLEPPDGSPGALESLDLNDQATVQPVATMMNQLISAGPLTQHLQSHGALTREQAALNERIKSDYLQQVMNEILTRHQVRQGQPQNADERNLQVNTVSRYLYGMSARDAISSYYRQLADAAPHAEQIIAVMDIPRETIESLRPFAAKAQSAETVAEQRSAVRELLNNLDFGQRREFLQRALEIVPEKDLLAPDAA